jgi:hypothetical protein
MNNKKHWLALGVSGLATIAAGMLASAPVSKAETVVEFVPAQAAGGVQVRIGECPCFRWQIAVQAASGHWENQEVLISSQQLFEYAQTSSADFQDVASQVFKAGQFELYAKEAHVGVGFKGVQWGNNADQGFKSLLRTGAYAIINMLGEKGRSSTSSKVTLDGHVGYDWEKFVTIVRQEEIQRGLVTGALQLSFDSGPFRGAVIANTGIDTSHIDFSHMVFGAEANTRFVFGKLEDIEFGLGGKVAFKHDPVYGIAGVNENQLITQVVMDVSWAARDHTN